MSDFRDGSRVKSDSRGPCSDLYLDSVPDSDFELKDSDPELNVAGSSLSEAVK